MSEQESNRISDNLGDVVGAAPAASGSSDVAPGEPTPGSAKDSVSVEAPKLASQSGADQTKDAKAEVATDMPNADAKVEPKPEAPKSPGKIMIMSPTRDHAWSDAGAHAEAPSANGKSGIFGKRRVAALAAVIALAAMAGAIGGALATAGLTHLNGEPRKVADNPALESAIARIDTEVAALRTSLEQASKHSAAQLSKASDRLDKVEKAQAEPAAKLAKLSEAVDRLRTASTAAPVPAPVVAAAAPAAPAAPKESTASIQTANVAPVPLPPAKPEIARLPTVEGWVLRDVGNGSALIESRQGMYEVYAGDPIPGLGRIDAIRKQDGRWVVITSRGLIVAR